MAAQLFYAVTNNHIYTKRLVTLCGDTEMCLEFNVINYQKNMKKNTKSIVKIKIYFEQIKI